ncbi:hypothetical protein EOA88_00395 [Mesorhizobium sp. M5C.F.Ca.IN.020.14.1.1]|nr:hypothetical protein EOA88_00395 [Mesorhizobium sp. M5C.F.Ca.IN.020.14.1.1]
MLATLTGCSTDAALRKAATGKGIAAARVTLPPLPGDCREMEPHAPVKVGDEARSVLKAERRQLDKANARVGRCANHYDATAKALK